MFKIKNQLNYLALFLILLMFILIVYFAAIGYSNVLSIVAPIAIFIGFWVWQQQELMKRKADASENLIKAYCDLESNVMDLQRVYLKTIWLGSYESDENDLINLVMEIAEKRDKCLISKSKFIADANIFFHRTSEEDNYEKQANFINNFNDFDNLIRESKDIENLLKDPGQSILFVRKFEELVGTVYMYNFGEEEDKPQFLDKPRETMKKYTANYFSLRVLFD